LAYLSFLPERRQALLKGVLRVACWEAWESITDDPTNADLRREIQKIAAELETGSLEKLDQDKALIGLEALHRAMYYLGPEDLHTRAGYELTEFVSAGQLLASVAFGSGIYIDKLWCEF
jgi:hypothetical protein